MKKLKQFLKFQADKYDNIEVEWIKGEQPKAHFFDADGAKTSKGLMPDMNHGDLLEWFEKEHNFVPKNFPAEWTDAEETGDFQGHHYEYYNSRATHEEALAFAATRSHNGMQGYPVVITSKAENAFVKSLFVGATWLGGAMVEGLFRWQFGPEEGQTFGQPDDGAFVSWAPGEPNNAHDREHCVVFLSALGWNDEECVNKFGVVIEYGDKPAVAAHDEL